MTNELTPVPCGCGGEAKVGRGYIASSTPYMVYCTKCKIVTKDYTTEAEAVQAWNRAMGGNVQECAKDARCYERTAKVKTVEKPNVFKCGECGQYFHQTAWGSPVEYCSRCGARLEWEHENL